MKKFAIVIAILVWGFGVANLQAQEPTLKFDRVFEQEFEINPAILQDSDGFLWVGAYGALIRYDGTNLTFYKDELTNTDVGRLLEDKEGLLWISTASGLNVYDKNKNTFTHYLHEATDNNSLSTNALRTIYEDKEGLIWIGTRERGLDMFDKRSQIFTHYPHDPDDANSLSHNSVRAIFQDSEGIFWIGTQEGLNRFDKVSQTFTRYLHDPNDEQSLGNDWIYTIVEDNNGILWLGTNDGLSRFDKKSQTFSHFRADPNDPTSLGDNEVYNGYKDLAGNIWFAHGFARDAVGISVLDVNSKTFTRYISDPNNPSTISSNAITAFYQNPETGIMWIANGNGFVDKYDPQSHRFNLYQNDPNNPRSLSSSVVVPLFEDSSHTIWVGTSEGGLNRYNRAEDSFTHFTHDPNDPTTFKATYTPAIFEDSAGDFWVGVAGGILSEFDRATGKVVQHFEHDPNNPQSISEARQVNRIIEDHDQPNILWVSALDGALEKFDKTTATFTHFVANVDDPNSLSSNAIRHIFDDDKGMLWICTDSGFNGLDKATEKVTRYFHDKDNPTSISHDQCYNSFIDSRGTFWVGTQDGLDKFDRDTQKFTHYNEASGHGIGIVFSLVEDAAQHLWLGTNEGLLKFDLETETVVRRYDQADGLQGNNFFINSALKSHDGQLWFGGQNGVSVFYPDKLRDNPHVPKIALTSFKQNGEVVDLGMAAERVNAINLKPQNNFFEFNFAVLNYTQAQKNKFAYMLEGVDRDWYYPDRPFGRYSGLAGGDYLLRLKGANNDGLWNEAGRVITVHVEPSLLETTWFRVSLAVLALATVFGAYRWRVWAVERKNKELEALVKERTLTLEQQAIELREAKIKADSANQAKSDFLSAMSHELRTPLNGILGYAQILRRKTGLNVDVMNGLNVIYQSGSHLLTLINDILDLSKVEARKMELHTESVHLAVFLESVVGIIFMRAREKGIEFKQEFKSLPAVVILDEKRLRQVLLNLLGNAVKFTAQGAVTLRVSQILGQGQQVLLRFEVEDSGVGIAGQDIEKIFQPFEQTGEAKKRSEGTGLGLTISRQLVALMGGTIQVRSELGQGSLFWFELTLPLGEADEALFGQKIASHAIVGYEGARRRVLVVDDASSNRYLLRALLEPLGFEIEEAENGAVAFDLTLQFRPDLIITDVVMPEVTGFELIEKIRAMPDLAATHIIVVSASSFDTRQKTANVTKYDGYLNKPIDIDQLLELMGQSLGLEWEYGAEGVVPEQPMMTVVVPQDELAELYQYAAKEGNMRKVRLKGEALLTELGAEYHPFIKQVLELARGYEEKKLRALLEQYL